MKKTIIIIAAITFALIFNACDKDYETPKPSIDNLEIGNHNSKIGYVGADLHIEAAIIAEGRIERIVIEIHYSCDHDHEHDDKNGHHHHEWEFEKTYDEFSGLKNTHFHKHIDIPEDIKTGYYHFHFRVVDKEGYTAEVNEDIDIRSEE